MYFKKLIISFIVLLFSITAFPQSDSISILSRKLKDAKSSFEKASLNVSLAYAYINQSIDSSKSHFKRAKFHFPISNNYQTKAENLLRLKIIMLEGDIALKLGKLADAESIFLSVLNEQYLNVTLKAYCLVQLGGINDYQSDPITGIKYYDRAKQIYDSIGDIKGISECLNNMGVILFSQGETNKAIEYLEKALELRRNISTKSEIADLIENLGSMYLVNNNLQLCLKYYTEGLDLYRSENNLWGITYALKNLAKYNIKIKNYDEAIAISDLIIHDCIRPNDSTSFAMYGCIKAEALYLKGDLKNSIKYARIAYNMAFDKDMAQQVREPARILKDAYAADGNFKEAYKFFGIYILMRDSLSNNKTEKETLKQRLENEKKTEKILYEKDLQIKESEANRKNSILIMVGFGLIVILIFSGVLLKKFKETKKQKKIIEEQKDLVEDKQKEILDSINYAKRIQNAILAREKDIKVYLPNSFLLYQPKDIIAGDFYFFEVTATHIFYAAADCTGHGVPGALMSVVCSNSLMRAVKEFGLSKPGEILDKTRELVVETLKKSGEEVKDGMDISLIAMPRKNSLDNVQWAGANNPIWLIKNKEFVEIRGDKEPIGLHENQKPFTSHTLSLSKGDMIFLFTDGYADQFGGPKGKKFKYKQFQELLLSISTKQATLQLSELEEQFKKWKGQLEQVDDICVIGITV